MAYKDLTLSDDSLFGSDRWAAAQRSPTLTHWKHREKVFFERRNTLNGHLPPLNCRQVNKVATMTHSNQSKGVNLDHV